MSMLPEADSTNVPATEGPRLVTDNAGMKGNNKCDTQPSLATYFYMALLPARITTNTLTGRMIMSLPLCGCFALLGLLNTPRIPRIPGLATFTGTAVHTAAWDHTFDLTGKRVAVVGTGASAIQVVPNIQKQAEQLYVFQRSAAWVLNR